LAVLEVGQTAEDAADLGRLTGAPGDAGSAWPRWNVYPDESILALEQRLELLNGTLLNALIGYQANVHPARHLPD
jgi:hypothetical protein